MRVLTPGAARRVPAVLSALSAVVLLTLLAACGGGGQATSAVPDTAGSEAPLFGSLPAEFRESGTIRVGSDIAYAPMEYYDTDGTTVLGLDKELADALGERLGVRLEFQNATFDGLITQLKSERIDLIMSGMSDTAERQQEIDFVDYYVAGAVLIVKKGNPEGLASLADLCGRTVAVQRGTTQEGYAEEQSAACESSGSEPIEILAFDRETEALLQVKQGRAAAGMEDYPVAAYNARTSGGGADFELVGDQIQAGPLGIGVSKDRPDLRDALREALQSLIDDGTYQALLEKWDVPKGAVAEATVNAGT